MGSKHCPIAPGISAVRRGFLVRMWGYKTRFFTHLKRAEEYKCSLKILKPHYMKVKPQSNSKTGVRGVFPVTQRGKTYYRASYKIDDKWSYKSFKTFEEAFKVRQAWEKTLLNQARRLKTNV